MHTNLKLDDALIDEAVRLGGHDSKKDAVTEALRDYVARLKQRNLVRLFGQIDFDPEYDYKAERARR